MLSLLVAFVAPVAAEGRPADAQGGQQRSWECERGEEEREYASTVYMQLREALARYPGPERYPDASQRAFEAKAQEAFASLVCLREKLSTRQAALARLVSCLYLEGPTCVLPPGAAKAAADAEEAKVEAHKARAAKAEKGTAEDVRAANVAAEAAAKAAEVAVEPLNLQKEWFQRLVDDGLTLEDLPAGFDTDSEVFHRLTDALNTHNERGERPNAEAPLPPPLIGRVAVNGGDPHWRKDAYVLQFENNGVRWTRFMAAGEPPRGYVRVRPVMAGVAASGVLIGGAALLGARLLEARVHDEEWTTTKHDASELDNIQSANHALVFTGLSAGGVAVAAGIGLVVVSF